MHSVGETVDGAEILEINEGSVTLRHHDRIVQLIMKKGAKP